MGERRKKREGHQELRGHGTKSLGAWKYELLEAPLLWVFLCLSHYVALAGLQLTETGLLLLLKSPDQGEHHHAQLACNSLLVIEVLERAQRHNSATPQRKVAEGTHFLSFD